MTEQEFKKRTRQLALNAVRLTESLPNRDAARIMGRQLLRCATSIGANYRAACQGKSTPDMIAKLSIVEEEADETMYWMELLVDSGFVSESQGRLLMREADEILSMTVASIKTLRSKNERPPIQNPKSKIQNRQGHP
jgi:four helix bundle protein